MKKRINPDMSREDLDSFLQEHYGYGIWEFETSIVHIYSLYVEKRRIYLNKFIESRVELLISVKNKIFEVLDDCLEKINFYKWNEELNFTAIKNWTSDKRIKFISEAYKLNEFTSILDNQVKVYENLKTHSIYDKVKKSGIFPPYIKPLNLLILIWSFALKRGKKIDWINMEKLLEWFFSHIKDIDKMDLFPIEKQDIPSAETLRLLNYKYKNTSYGVYAKVVFVFNFNIQVNEDKYKHPQPLIELEQSLDTTFWWDKNYLKEDIQDEDAFMLIKWIHKYSGLRKQKKREISNQ